MLDRRQRIRRAGVAAVAVTAGALVLASCGNDSGPSNGQNALRPAGPNAQKILDLTRPFFWIAVLVGVGVLVGTIYVALRFRVRKGETREPVQSHGNSALEISWTIVPALILAVMAVPTVATVFDLAKKPTGADVVHVTVSARQWWWQFTYTDKDNGVVTANELHIPVNQPVYLSLQGPPKCTSPGCYNNGVIHSFWIPELNGKKDVVPGRTQFLTIEASRTGVFLGQCAEYCGLSHADMRMRVVAQTRADYDAWVQSQNNPKPAADLLAGINDKQWGCSGCHSFEPKKAGSVAPNLAKLAARCAFAGDIYKMDFDNLWKWVHDAPSRKPMGNLTSHMPNFSATPGTDGKTMTEDEAKQIAQFLLDNTATTKPAPAECQR
jgi:cytochrome c oxidase subunit 2